ncbi:D-alanyl-D-alanine carboxypeptidase family protein [Hyphomicrobium sulfonivorans]|uniref:D-alanyl-D-alanine carboxypeptidase family protein n=1 Tax=Hyphomicrobium sulfonivorans TaxID=121290 RepID=UPI00156EDE5E|nr:D-alanyl-D-alanine carboxypeptidase family protein [Hyphomicrobium sulfonivorans]MBI1648619.1 D-alanyl-D-alanine carboxypeptidase [Hyphomicrobium sulfonivorans]
MRRDVGIISLAALMVWGCAAPAVAASASGSSLVFDFEDGHVLYAEDIDQPWYPASLTKMMTAYMAFTAIKEGRAKKDTKVKISAAAYKMPPTRLGMKTGSEITLDDALRALMMRSANDVAVAIAETLGGDEASFVKQMNQTAARLGMTHTHFINPHGLPAEKQVSTARDMGLLSQALLKDFPEEAPLYSLTSATIGKITIGTHNALLTSFDGGDGIKTGYTCASGYNLAASATRDGRRLIAIVLGAPSNSARTARASALLESGFRTHEWKTSFPIARLQNYPREVIGTPYEPDELILGRFRACSAPPPPPKPEPATASADSPTKAGGTAAAPAAKIEKTSAQNASASKKAPRNTSKKKRPKQ